MNLYYSRGRPSNSTAAVREACRASDGCTEVSTPPDDFFGLADAVAAYVRIYHAREWSIFCEQLQGQGQQRRRRLNEGVSQAIDHLLRLLTA